MVHFKCWRSCNTTTTSIRKENVPASHIRRAGVGWQPHLNFCTVLLLLTGSFSSNFERNLRKMLPGWWKNPQPYSIDDVSIYSSNLDESERGESLTFQSLKTWHWSFTSGRRCSQFHWRKTAVDILKPLPGTGILIDAVRKIKYHHKGHFCKWE